VPKNVKKRSRWSKPWLLKRENMSHGQLLKELRLEPKDYSNYIRMDERTYLELLAMVTPFIEKEHTMLRTHILSKYVNWHSITET
jgi:hypothetical protein